MIFLITGSTGMIGLSLTKYLLKLNHKVIMFVRENSKKLDLIPNNENVTIVECNLENLHKCNIDIKADYFIHLGWDKTFGSNARNDVDTQLDNIKYCLDACRLAKKIGCKKFIGIGSQAEYGFHNEPLGIETCCNPITGYGIAKYTAGKLSNILCQQSELEFNWIRVLSVYGKHDNPNTLISYVTRCLENNISPDVTKCEQIWDYISADEAAKIIYKIATDGKNGVTYPLGSGRAVKLKDYLEELKNKINPNIKINYGAKSYQDNQVMYLVADMSYLKEL